MRKKILSLCALLAAMVFVTSVPTDGVRAETATQAEDYEVSNSELGDVDFDEDVDLSDAEYALKGSLGIVPFSEKEKAVADIDRNGTFELSDVIYILRGALGIIDLSKGELEPDTSNLPISNPTGKKGIIASYWTDEGKPYYDDPIALGVDHALFNIDMTDLINTDKTGEAFVYNGKTYYFNNTGGIHYIMLRMREVRDKGIALTVQIAMRWPEKSDGTVDQELLNYIYPYGREAGHGRYALNTSSEESRQAIGAAFHYLVTKCPYVNNWIVGCEVNSANTANYCGTLDVNTNATLAAQAYNLMQQAIDDVSPTAKTYLCLDNIWNSGISGQGISAKTFLDVFAKKMEGKAWNVAYHPYPVPYGANDDASEWNLWSKKASQYIDHTEDTKFLTGANLEVLTDYIRRKYGSNHRVILSEFGYDSRAGEDAQAAALYYTFKAAERDPMIDACIYQPWIDNGWDFREMGIETAEGRKKAVYDVFKYMDSDAQLAKETYYLNYLGIKSWTDNIIYIDKSGGDIKITGVYIPEDDGKIIKAGAVITGYRENVTFECTVIDYDYQKYGTKMYPQVMRTKSKNNNWMEYVPTHPGMYGFMWRVYDSNGNIISEAGATHLFD